MQYHGGSVFDWSRPPQGSVAATVPARYHLVPPGLLPKVIVWGQSPQGTAATASNLARYHLLPPGLQAKVIVWGPNPQGTASAGVVAVPQTGPGDRTRKKRGKVGGRTVWFDTPEELATLRDAYRNTLAERKAAAKRSAGAVAAEPQSGTGLLGEALRAAYQTRGLDFPEIDHAAQRLMVRKRQDEEALMLLLSD